MATTSAPSTALMSFQGGGDSGFSNSGQIDWVTLAGTSVKFTVDVLARLSKAGIEAFTLAASYALLGRFKPSDQAEIRIQESVGKLRAFSSFNNALYFGFGVKHIVRSLADSSEGLSIISISAILSDFYGIEYSGLILREMFKLLQPPAELTPTLLQWRNIVKVCAGALSHSNFNHHLAHIFRLYCGRSGQPPTQIPRGNHNHIAAALHELNQVASGKINEAVFVGGADCALIAAIASWLLDLNVEIRTEDQQQMLFKHASATKRKTAGGYFVAVLYTQTANSNLQSQSSLTRASGYRCVVEVQQLFTTPASETPLHMAICTRVNWSTALSDTVGEYSEEFLSGDSAALAGNLFGLLMVRSLFAKLYREEKPYEYSKSRSSTFWKYIGKANQGMGLLEAVERWFPESANTVFSTEARATYKKLLTSKSDETVLGRQVLGAWLRISRIFPEAFHFEEHPKPETKLLHDFIWLLYHITRCLSSCQVDESILPSRAGILFLYKYGRTRFKYQNIHIPPIAIAQVIFSGKDLDIVSQHAGGDKAHIPADGNLQCAKSTNGVCFALNSLIQLTDDQDEVGKLWIFSGTIQYQTDYYDQIVDDQGPYPVADSNFTEGVKSGQSRDENKFDFALDDSPVIRLENMESQSLDNDKDCGFSTELLVTDAPGAFEPLDRVYGSTLWAHYRLTKGHSRPKTLNVRPAEFVNVILDYTVLNFSWGHSLAESDQTSSPSDDTTEPLKIKISDLEFVFVPMQTLLTGLSTTSLSRHMPTRHPGDLSYPPAILVDDLFVKTAILLISSKNRAVGRAGDRDNMPHWSEDNDHERASGYFLPLLTEPLYLRNVDISEYMVTLRSILPWSGLTPVIILQR